MLVGIVGTRCSGKESIAEYLVNKHNFTKIIISKTKTTPDDCSTLIFDNAMNAMDYVLQEFRWEKDHVIYPLDAHEDFEELQKRPFFLLVSVDASITIRYQRFLSKHQQSLTLDHFVQNHDDLLFNSKTPLNHILHSADLRLTNNFQTISELYEYLDKCDIRNNERCRPSWDTYFIKLCEWAARRSNCMKRRVGCILVKDKRIIATGYNGTPRGVRNCNEGGCPRCNSGVKCGQALDLCLCIHAEENALLEAGRERIENSGGHTILYCNTCPCLGCAKKIIQSGVREVVYHLEYGMDDLTRKLMKEAGIILRKYQGVADAQHVQLCNDSTITDGIGEFSTCDTESNRLTIY